MSYSRVPIDRLERFFRRSVGPPTFRPYKSSQGPENPSAEDEIRIQQLGSIMACARGARLRRRGGRFADASRAICRVLVGEPACRHGGLDRTRKVSMFHGWFVSSLIGIFRCSPDWGWCGRVGGAATGGYFWPPLSGGVDRGRSPRGCRAGARSAGGGRRSRRGVAPRGGGVRSQTLKIL